MEETWKYVVCLLVYPEKGPRGRLVCFYVVCLLVYPEKGPRGRLVCFYVVKNSFIQSFIHIKCFQLEGNGRSLFGRSWLQHEEQVICYQLEPGNNLRTFRLNAQAVIRAKVKKCEQMLLFIVARPL